MESIRKYIRKGVTFFALSALSARKLNIMPVELEKYKGRSTRHTCPGCNGKHEFSRYVDTSTGQYIADHVGMCNNLHKCGYHYPPAEFYKENPDKKTEARPYVPIEQKQEPEKPVQYIPATVAQATFRDYDKNNLALGLSYLFSPVVTTELIDKYCIGTAKLFPGACVYWQKDIEGRFRQCKIMQYDPLTVKRVKGIDVVFYGKKILKDPDANLQQSFFGEHLLNKRPGATVCITEAEKTAIVASVFMPQFIWIAAGGAVSGCKWMETKVHNVLKGRKVILYPDHGYYYRPKDKPEKWITCFEKWSERAEAIRAISGIDITVSELLERSGIEKDGSDIADYLLMNRSPVKGIALNNSGYPALWDYDTPLFTELLKLGIDELERRTKAA